jgi:aminopeptidase YwaD
VEAPLACATTLDKPDTATASGRGFPLRGELAREPLIPKHFPFHNPDEHKHLIQQQESLRPAAIITAAPRNPR